ncbi:M10 family metallopeptidase C-terminal domain-containing protein [Leisingera sp. D0M16]|uniref:M10 family metallopeptidase C-terminal domain-containing protein n=1 Tax=Leisingera coralii TaxID=3351347 RepID=UPI003B7DDA61
MAGGTGNDELTGGSGNDHFEFNQGDGADLITDFGDGFDTLDLRSFGFTSEAEVFSNASQISKNVVFDFGNGDKLTLQEVELEDLKGNVLY